jgi:RNA polymerase sigma factor (sigma-70 family)
MSEAAAPGGMTAAAGLLGALSDDRLARRAVGGDERAFAAIFRRYHQRLYRFSLAIVGNPEDAQDALQNTMVKVLRALPGEERRIDLKPWLYRIAHNESIEVLRRRRETRELDADLPARGPGLAEEAGTRERLRRLLADLDELPERQRETLVMRELGGLDYAEIAAALETTAAVARQAVYEARLGLRQMDEGREMSCETVTRALSDGDGRVTRRRDVRAHLRTCADCRRFRDEIAGRRRDLAALSPLPAVAATGLLQGLLGSAGGGSSSGLAAALGGGAAKSAGASVALKGVATVAVVAAVGVGAADRGGLIDAGLPGGSSSSPTGTQKAGAGPARGGGAGGVSEAGAVAPGPRSKQATGVENGASAGEVKAPPASAQAPVAGGGAEAGAGGGSRGTSNGTEQATSHPHGKGHEKALPAASAHGQQTAAAHKGSSKGSNGAGHGSSGGGGKAAQPSKPPQPSGASNGAEKGASAAAPKGGKEPAQAGGGAPVTPVDPALESASGHGQGKSQEKP